MSGTGELSLLAVEPHPDDESIGMGGTLARYSAEGVRTTLVTATRGEVGEILDKDLDPKEAAPRLATIREGELRNAVKVLGVKELVFLGYEDSGMAGLRRRRSHRTVDPGGAPSPTAGDGHPERVRWLCPPRPHHDAPGGDRRLLLRR
ncbi:MAG: hypothetical protein E6I74_07300 [Chloroflexi bacterium]|nr:MAG: hypothetical protein E6I74_07300 [Chloroflexota bacterium]